MMSKVFTWKVSNLSQVLQSTPLIPTLQSQSQLELLWFGTSRPAKTAYWDPQCLQNKKNLFSSIISILLIKLPFSCTSSSPLCLKCWANLCSLPLPSPLFSDLMFDSQSECSVHTDCRCWKRGQLLKLLGLLFILPSGLTVFFWEKNYHKSLKMHLIKISWK